MGELKLLFTAFLVILLSINTALALSPLPPLYCSLGGTIKTVEFAEAGCAESPWEDKCWEDEYKLELEIKEVSTVSSIGSCEETYPLNSLQKISIPKEKVNEGDVFEVNSKISGSTSRRFGTQFTSYVLEISEEPQKTTNSNLLLFGGIVIVIIIILFLIIKFMKKKKQ